MNGRIRELETELSGEIMNQQQKYNVDAGRDVSTDLTPWQAQAMKRRTIFAIKQGFRRHHPRRLLGALNQGQLNSQHPRMAWEKAIRDDQKRTEIPEVYKKVRMDMPVTQIGLVVTARKNYEKSQSLLDMTNMVGM